MYTRNLTSAAVLVLCLCCTLAAQPQCSTRDAVGVWAYSSLGWSIPTGGSEPVPMTMIGITITDSSGKVTGPGTFTSGAPIPGTPIPAGMALDFDMVNATIQVNADCTALLKYSIQLKGLPVPPIGPYYDRMILLPAQGESLGMGVVSPTSKPMWVYTSKRMSWIPWPVSWPAVPAQ